MPVAFRQGIRGQFESYDFRRAFEIIEIELGHAYDYFYTKAPLFYRGWGCIFRSITRFIFCVFVFFLVKERQRSESGFNYHLHTAGWSSIYRDIYCDFTDFL